MAEAKLMGGAAAAPFSQYRLTDVPADEELIQTLKIGDTVGLTFNENYEVSNSIEFINFSDYGITGENTKIRCEFTLLKDNTGWGCVTIKNDASNFSFDTPFHFSNKNMLVKDYKGIKNNSSLYSPESITHSTRIFELNNNFIYISICNKDVLWDKKKREEILSESTGVGSCNSTSMVHIYPIKNNQFIKKYNNYGLSYLNLENNNISRTGFTINGDYSTVTNLLKPYSGNCFHLYDDYYLITQFNSAENTNLITFTVLDSKNYYLIKSSTQQFKNAFVYQNPLNNIIYCLYTKDSDNKLYGCASISYDSSANSIVITEEPTFVTEDYGSFGFFVNYNNNNNCFININKKQTLYYNLYLNENSEVFLIDNTFPFKINKFFTKSLFPYDRNDSNDSSYIFYNNNLYIFGVKNNNIEYTIAKNINKAIEGNEGIVTKIDKENNTVDVIYPM